MWRSVVISQHWANLARLFPPTRKSWTSSTRGSTHRSAHIGQSFGLIDSTARTKVAVNSTTIRTMHERSDLAYPLSHRGSPPSRGANGAVLRWVHTEQRRQRSAVPHRAGTPMGESVSSLLAASADSVRTAHARFRSDSIPHPGRRSVRFRDSNSKVSFLANNCAHRGAVRWPQRRSRPALRRISGSSIPGCVSCPGDSQHVISRVDAIPQSGTRISHARGAGARVHVDVVEPRTPVTNA
jgi:hypothetical protein